MDDELRALQDVWERFGRLDPMLAVLTDPARAADGWSEEEFFATGRTEVEATLEWIATLGVKPVGGPVLDFGCGIGRITRALAAQVGECTGVDIAPAMIERAQRGDGGGPGCRYVLNERDDLALFGDGTFAMVYSRLVLQHVPPGPQRRYLAELLRVLAPGGIAVLQLIVGRAQLSAEERLPDGAHTAAIALTAPLPTFVRGEAVPLAVTVTNRSPVLWPVLGPAPLRLGNHWEAAPGGAVLAYDDGRTNLPADLPPGATAELELVVTPPATSGRRADLVLDIVEEGVCWFAERGSNATRIPVTVSGRRWFRNRPAPPRPQEPANDGGRGRLDELPAAGMHPFPAEEFRAAVESAGVVIAGEIDDRSAPGFVSRVFCLTRPASG
jgi:SAM-dependent methyltransferase